MIVSLVTPYARTNWHTRAVGQTLHVTDGLGLVVTCDGTTIRMRPGDTVYTRPGEEQRNGATADNFREPFRDARRHRRRRPHHLAPTHRRGRVQRANGHHQ